MRWVRWHHQFNGRESEQTPGDGGGQGSLACCSPWGHKGLDMTERLNDNRNAKGQILPHPSIHRRRNRGWEGLADSPEAAQLVANPEVKPSVASLQRLSFSPSHTAAQGSQTD